jgi:hypothetical protein
MTECPVITAMDFDFSPGRSCHTGLYARMSFTDYRTVYTRI